MFLYRNQCLDVSKHRNLGTVDAIPWRAWGSLFWEASDGAAALSQRAKFAYSEQGASEKLAGNRVGDECQHDHCLIAVMIAGIRFRTASRT
jgi:hypothetical protein